MGRVRWTLGVTCLARQECLPLCVPHLSFCPSEPPCVATMGHHESPADVRPTTSLVWPKGPNASTIHTSDRARLVNVAKASFKEAIRSA